MRDRPEDQVRRPAKLLPKPPSTLPRGQLEAGEGTQVTRRRTRIDPADDRGDLFVAQRGVVLEVLNPHAPVHEPGRHLSARHLGLDQGGVAARILIAEERHGRRTSVSVACDAAFPNDRRDMICVRDVLSPRGRRSQEHEGHRRQRDERRHGKRGTTGHSPSSHGWVRFTLIIWRPIGFRKHGVPPHCMVRSAEARAGRRATRSTGSYPQPQVRQSYPYATWRPDGPRRSGDRGYRAPLTGFTGVVWAGSLGAKGGSVHSSEGDHSCISRSA